MALHLTEDDLLSAGGNVAFSFNSSTGEYTLTASVSSTDVDAAGSQGELQFNDSGNLGASSDLTWDGSSLAVSGFTLTPNNTANTSGDLQIRDDSNGDLFSLDDGSSPTLSLKYEGSRAFTIGYSGVPDETLPAQRTGVVLNGTDGFPNYASGNVAFSTGSGNIAAGVASNTLGFENNSHVFGSTVTGFWADDWLYSADPSDEPSNNGEDYNDLQDGHRVFRVGVGDNPDAVSGDNFYYDGRGRQDGLYVTMRDGTFIRHGLKVDGYNASLGQYETVFEVNEDGDIVEGNLDVSNLDVTAAGSDTQIQYNDGGSFGASPDLTFDDSSTVLEVTDGQFTTGNEGIFGGFWDAQTKGNFSLATATSKSEIPTAFGRPVAPSVQGKFNIDLQVDEDLDFSEAAFFYNITSSTTITASNSQGYVDFVDTDVDLIPIFTEGDLSDVRGSNFQAWGSQGFLEVRGDNTDLTGKSQIIGVQGAYTLSDGGSLPLATCVDANYDLSSFTGTVDEIYGFRVTNNARKEGGDKVDPSTFTFGDAYGIRQDGPWMKNLYEAPMMQSSGPITSGEDNRTITYSLNQRTTDSAQATLQADSQTLQRTPTAQQDATWQFEGKVVARVEENTASSLSGAIKGDTHVWELEGVFSTDFDASVGQNVTRFIGSPVVSTKATDASVSDYTVTISASDGELNIDVQAENGAIVNWTAKLEVVELVA